MPGENDMESSSPSCWGNWRLISYDRAHLGNILYPRVLIHIQCVYIFAVYK